MISSIFSEYLQFSLFGPEDEIVVVWYYRYPSPNEIEY